MGFIDGRIVQDTDGKSILDKIGVLTNLTTTEKNSLVGAVNENAASLADIVNKTSGTISVESYGAKGDWNGTTGTDDSTAIQNAINAAMALNGGLGGTVRLANKRYLCNNPITIKNVNFVGVFGTEIDFRGLASGVSAVTINRDSGKPHPTIKDVSFVGDGVYQLGVQTCLFNGIEIINDTKPKFDNIQITQFNKGMIWNNTTGHIRIKDSVIAYNYYGIYCKQNTGDYGLINTDVNQNSFANFATNASTGIDGLDYKTGHCGFSPFSFYCEPSPSNALNGNQNKNQFLFDLNLDGVRFEQVGNAAFYSDYSQSANPLVASAKIKNPGFSWQPTYRLGGYPYDFAIDFARVQDGEIEIEADYYPFVAGNINVMRVRNLVAPAHINLKGKGCSPSQVQVDSGVFNVNAGISSAPVLSDGMLAVTSIGGGFNQLVTNGSTVVYSPVFANNASKRGIYFIYADVSSNGGIIVFNSGSELDVMTSTGGTNFAVGTTNPNTAGKINVFLNGVNISINNQIGSDRRIAIVPMGFF